MQPTMPGYLSLTATHVTRRGAQTTVPIKGSLYKNGDCTWELCGPAGVLHPKKDHNIMYYIGCGPTVTAGRYCFVLCD